jgi:hypothetical protein
VGRGGKHEQLIAGGANQTTEGFTPRVVDGSLDISEGRLREPGAGRQITLSEAAASPRLSHQLRSRHAYRP